MPFRYGIGDHRAYVLDIPLEELVGENPIKIVRPAGRRLNSKLPGCNKAYVKSLEDNIVAHRLLERLHDAHTGEYSDSERAKKVIIIDKEGKAYMRHAKKICRKLKCCRIPFSPEAALWIRRVKNILLTSQISQGKTQEQRKSKTGREAMQHP
jgi:hypothetical protein